MAVLSGPEDLAPVEHGREEGSYLGFVIQLLWPEPARVSSGSRRDRARRKESRSFVVIPSSAKPKLIIPRRPRRVAAAAARNFKTASTSREQLAIGTLALALRLGLADFLPDRLQVEYGEGVAPVDIEAHLSRVLGRRLHVSLYIGPPRAVRKPVLQVLDENGSTFAFAKLGVDAFTDELVRTEAETVSALSGSSWSVLAVPALLHSGLWQGHELLVQTAFPRGGGAKPGGRMLGRAMDELARARGVRSARLRDSTYWRRLTGRVQDLPPSEFTAVLVRSLVAIEQSRGGVELEFGSWHGDWAQWNMTVAGDRVCVWDWEKFENDVPVGFDAVHFDVQGAVVVAATPPAQAFRDTLGNARELLQPHAVGADAAALIVWLYAVDIATRYLEDRELTAGLTRMSRLSNWLETVLDAAVGSSGASRP